MNSLLFITRSTIEYNAVKLLTFLRFAITCKIQLNFFNLASCNVLIYINYLTVIIFVINIVLTININIQCDVITMIYIFTNWKN